MRVINLHLENFQQFKDKKVSFDDGHMSFAGRNETGKTTVANAYMWLLTGKAYTNEPNYSPQTTKNDKLVHHLVHSVTGLFENEEGRFVLRRAYKEKWTKSRNSIEEVLTGGTYIYEIDGVNTTKKAFDEFVTASFGTAETIQILSKPEFFAENSSEMSWQRRREIIMKLTSDISDEEVIASNPDLADLPTYLQKPGGTGTYTVDQLKEIARAEVKKTKEQAEEIPARIDENTRNRPNKMSVAEILAKGEEIDKLKQLAVAKDQEAKQLAEQDSDQARRSKMAELRIKISERKSKLSDLHMEATQAAQDKIIKYHKLYREAINEQEQTLDRKEGYKRLLSENNYNKDSLEKRISELQEQAWEGDATCYACGQNLPTGEIEAAKEAFNLLKAQDLEKLNAELKDTVDKIALVKKFLQNLKPEEEQAAKNVALALAKKEKAEAALREIAPLNVMADEEYQALQEEVDLLQEVRIDEGRQAEIDALRAERNEYMTKVKTLQEELATQEQIELIDARTAELEEEMAVAKRANEIAKRKVWLAQQFSRTKAELLSDPINSFFNPDLLQFKLFDELKNGDTVDACEVLIRSKEGNLIGFNQSANRAGKINGGLEIISVLSKLYGISLPIFVDNAESINDLHLADHEQVVALYVTDKDYELKGESINQKGEK